jgi:histidinol-phosphate aminotransferase
MRARVVATPMADHALDLEALARAISPRTKIVFLCTPNNPTGTILPGDEVARFMARVPDHVLVVFDQAYQEYVDDPGYCDGLDYCRAGRDNVLVLRTFSKIYGLAGLGVGYGIGHPSLLAPFIPAGERFSVNAVAQTAGLAALRDDAFMRTAAEMAIMGRAYLGAQLDRLRPFYVPSQTNFLWVEFGPRCPQIVEALLRCGIIIRPGAGYGRPEFVRITIGTPEENECFVGTLEAALADLGISTRKLEAQLAI